MLVQLPHTQWLMVPLMLWIMIILQLHDCMTALSAQVWISLAVIGMVRKLSVEPTVFSEDYD